MRGRRTEPATSHLLVTRYSTPNRRRRLPLSRARRVASGQPVQISAHRGLAGTLAAAGRAGSARGEGTQWNKSDRTTPGRRTPPAAMSSALDPIVLQLCQPSQLGRLAPERDVCVHLLGVCRSVCACVRARVRVSVSACVRACSRCALANDSVRRFHFSECSPVAKVLFPFL